MLSSGRRVALYPANAARARHDQPVSGAACDDDEVSSSSLGPEEVDKAFADIVARLDDAPGPPPSSSSDEPAAASPKAVNPTPVPWRVDPTGSVEKALLSEDAELFGGDDERFVPAPTQALPPATDKTFWVALVGLALGPVLLLVALLGRDSLSSWWAWAGLVLLVAGFGALVMRLPREREDPGDNGARV